MKNYEIFLSATDSKIEDKSRLRIDLYGNMKIKDVKELKDFNILYYSQGHQDNISLKGKIVNRKVRYIQVFKK
ncbi:MAG: hypothetical protein E7F83_03145 [Clostridium sp.]|uniref:Uncharacterized protein n=1 Tax=Clostridium tertium TaxID=1559 RepID=A0A6N3F3D0_9CLOT|nr:hypothetical protein [Clostridium sp.]MDU3546399.1 hypothetical protein [Clostridium sp.]